LGSGFLKAFSYKDGIKVERVVDKNSLFLLISADRCLAFSSSSIVFLGLLLKLLNVLCCVFYKTLFPCLEKMGLFLLLRKLFNESRFLK
jgi:hypothetical protein